MNIHCDVCGSETAKAETVKSGDKCIKMCPECHAMWRDWSRLERRVLTPRFSE